jgi:uncharacterized protein (DUF488 family)
MDMTNRQRALVRLISNEDGCITKLRLVKLSFLLQATAQEISRSSVYEFLPYQHGPYSFTLNHELRSVERDGWIRITDNEVKLVRSADAETKKLDLSAAKEVDSLSRRFKNVTTSTLVSRVYSDDPCDTAKAKDDSRRQAQVPIVEPMIFTVGYEGLMLDGLLDLLLRNGVTKLIDVRRNPVARRFGFHKSTMLRHCGDVGIKYIHVPELGVPSEKRTDLNDTKSYKLLFDYYEKDILPKQKAHVEAVSEAIQNEPSALMCMEADSACCHRSRLAAAVAKVTNLPIKELRTS